MKPFNLEEIEEAIAINLLKRLEIVEKQRNALIEALDYTASLLEASGRTALTARQAIAKAKGEK